MAGRKWEPGGYTTQQNSINCDNCGDAVALYQAASAAPETSFKCLGGDPLSFITSTAGAQNSYPTSNTSNIQLENHPTHILKNELRPQN